MSEKNENERCPGCAGDRGSHPLFCGGCGRLFSAPSDLDHYALFEIPMGFEIDDEELEVMLLQLSRRFHPDFFAGSDSDQQELSLQHSATVNTAHQVLREPYARAEYLLRLRGGKSSGEDKSTPEGFLQKTMFLREELEEAVEGEDDEALNAMNSQMTSESEQLLRETSKILEQLEHEDAESDALLAQARMNLNAAKYIRNLIHDSSGLKRPDAG